MRIDRKLPREDSGLESVESVQQCQRRGLAIWPVIPSYKVRAMQPNCAGTPVLMSGVSGSTNGLEYYSGEWTAA